jgi:hypothetical protein
MPTGWSITADANRSGAARSSAGDVRATDAHPDDVTPIDAEVVEQRELVGGVGGPAVVGRHRRGGPAGVALVHADHR